MVGRLDPVNLREFWAKGASDLTNWSSNNLGILSDHISGQ
jgi:hypothetical protein